MRMRPTDLRSHSLRWVRNAEDQLIFPHFNQADQAEPHVFPKFCLSLYLCLSQHPRGWVWLLHSGRTVLLLAWVNHIQQWNRSGCKTHRSWRANYCTTQTFRYYHQVGKSSPRLGWGLYETRRIRQKRFVTNQIKQPQEEGQASRTTVSNKLPAI